MSTLTLVFLWLLCGAISHAGLIAYFQNEFKLIARENYWNEHLVAGTMSYVAGPAALLSTAITTGWFKHGFSLCRGSEEL
jgi:hypothetical protein